MRTHSMFIVAFAVLAIVVPRSVDAAAFGVSPGTTVIQVFRGERFSGDFVVSKSDDSGELSLAVSHEGDDVMDFHGVSDLVLAEDESSQRLAYDIDASVLDVGQYAETVSFYKTEMDDIGAGAPVRLGMKASVRITVSDRPTAGIPISIVEHPGLAEEIAVTATKISQRFVTAGKEIDVRWTVGSTGMNPLDGAVATVSIQRDGRTVMERSGIDLGTVPARRGAEHLETFELHEPSPSGWYDAKISIGGKERVSRFFVVQPTAAVLCAMFAGGVIALGTGAVASVRVLRRRRRASSL